MTDIDQFRTDVAAWFACHTPHGWVDDVIPMNDADYLTFQRKWLQELNTRGFGAAAADPRWGGGGYTPREQAVIYDEWARAQAPGVDPFVVSLHHVPATLDMVGTPEQQDRYIADAINGTIWCQGFSEPGAGSDLAALRTRAEPVDGGWQVTGQKIWSSNADKADYCILLARTGEANSGSKGITYFILDMHTPGIDVRPIRQNTGYAEFCEIFLDHAFIPAENVIGDVDDGWRAAQSTLDAERGPAGFDIVARIDVALRQMQRQINQATTPISAATVVQLASLVARSAQVRSLALDIVDSLERGDSGGGLASMMKVTFSELLHDAMNFASTTFSEQSLLAPASPHHRGFVTGDWSVDWIGSWGWTIAAGTNEVQRNIIAERLLGLPREPRTVSSAKGESL